MSEPYDNPFLEKSNARRKKEEEKTAMNSGHLVSWQRTQAARTKMFWQWFPYLPTAYKFSLNLNFNELEYNLNRKLQFLLFQSKVERATAFLLRLMAHTLCLAQLYCCTCELYTCTREHRGLEIEGILTTRVKEYNRVNQSQGLKSARTTDRQEVTWRQPLNFAQQL